MCVVCTVLRFCVISRCAIVHLCVVLHCTVLHFLCSLVCAVSDEIEFRLLKCQHCPWRIFQVFFLVGGTFPSKEVILTSFKSR